MNSTAGILLQLTALLGRNLMTVKACAALLAFTLAATSAFAQGAQAPEAQPPKASKAEVQSVVDVIKSNPQKMAQFCDLMKLQAQYSTIGRDAKKLQELDNQVDEATKKLGPDFEKVAFSELDDESSALLDDLGATCK